MKLKTLAIALIGIPAAGFLAVYGYVWMQAKSTVADLATFASLFADVSYDSVVLTPSGTISVHNLNVSPHRIPERVGVERIALHTPGLPFLVANDLKSLPGGRLPGRMGISVEGLRIDTEGMLWVMSVGGGDSDDRPANGLACGIGDFVRMSGPLGILLPTQLVVDSELLIEPGAQPGAAAVRIASKQHGFMFMSVAGEILLPTQALAMESESSMPAFLTPIRIRAALDPGYAKAAQELCANRSGLPVEQFLPALLAQDDAAYGGDLGMIPGPGIRDLLRGFLDGAPIEAQFRFPPGMDPSTLGLYKPEDVPRLLDLRLTLNGSPVEDLSFRAVSDSSSGSDTFDTLDASAPAAPLPPTLVGPPIQAPPPTPISARRPGPDSETVTFDDLARCLGCRVQIALRDGRTREGIVDNAADGLVRIKSRLHGGSLTFDLRAGDIATIRVLGAR